MLPKCCTDINFIYPKLFFPEYQTPEEHEFLEVHGVNNMTLKELRAGAEDVSSLVVNIKHRCNQLGDDGLCKIYENRPEICRGFQCHVREDCACGGTGRIG